MLRSILAGVFVFLSVDLGLILAHLGLRKNSEFFCVAIAAGKASVVRGRVPAEFLADIKRAARAEPSVKGFVRATPALEESALHFRGLSEGSQQRLRNAFLTHPVSELRHAPKVRKRSLGQRIGLVPIEWIRLSRRTKNQKGLSLIDGLEEHIAPSGPKSESHVRSDGQSV
jgi:Protein of unknown function (DUF3634)